MAEAVYEAQGVCGARAGLAITARRMAGQRISGAGDEPSRLALCGERRWGSGCVHVAEAGARAGCLGGCAGSGRVMIWVTIQY